MRILISLVSIIVAVVALSVVIVNYALRPKLRTIHVGEVYQVAWLRNADDPFDETEPDTIMITDIRDDYARYRYNQGFYGHSDLDFLNHTDAIIKKLPPNCSTHARHPRH